MNSWPFLIVLVVLGVMMLLSTRNRRRQVAEQRSRASRIAVGTEVMTTSGLYGTVVARHDDDTVLLAIAAGVEVKWAAAALREAEAAADAYRPGVGIGAGEGRTDAGSARTDAGPGTDIDPITDTGGAGPDTEPKAADLRKKGNDSANS